MNYEAIDDDMAARLRESKMQLERGQALSECVTALKKYAALRGFDLDGRVVLATIDVVCGGNKFVQLTTGEYYFMWGQAFASGLALAILISVLWGGK